MSDTLANLCIDAIDDQDIITMRLLSALNVDVFDDSAFDDSEMVKSEIGKFSAALLAEDDDDYFVVSTLPLKESNMCDRINASKLECDDTDISLLFEGNDEDECDVFDTDALFPRNALSILFTARNYLHSESRGRDVEISSVSGRSGSASVLIDSDMLKRWNEHVMDIEKCDSKEESIEHYKIGTCDRSHNGIGECSASEVNVAIDDECPSLGINTVFESKVADSLITTMSSSQAVIECIKSHESHPSSLSSINVETA